MTDVTVPDRPAFVPSPGCPPPHPTPKRPQLTLPQGSVDAHCHVFGPSALFPYQPQRTFTPVDAPLKDVRDRQRFLGFSRSVIVQSSCYGEDHSALLDALRSDPENLRGVAMLTSRTSAATVDELDAAGVCGARLHFLPHLGEALPRTEQDHVVRTAHERGWHVEIHVQGTGVSDHADEIAAMRGPVIIDHMARVDLREGLDGPSVRSLLRLLDLGHVWVKLSGADRVSRSGPPYSDTIGLAALLASHAPERVLWGTDFPHVNIVGDAPDDGVLVDLVAQVTPREEDRVRMLVTNPTEIFGF